MINHKILSIRGSPPSIREWLEEINAILNAQLAALGAGTTCKGPQPGEDPLRASHAALLAAAKEALSVLSSYQAKKCLSVPGIEGSLRAAISMAEEIWR
jgi:hypothetical protein